MRSIRRHSSGTRALRSETPAPNAGNQCCRATRKSLASFLVTVGLSAAALALPAPAVAQVDPRGVDPGSPNPLEGVRFFVDRESPSWRQWHAYERAGRTDKADLIW